MARFSKDYFLNTYRAVSISLGVSFLWSVVLFTGFKPGRTTTIFFLLGVWIFLASSMSMLILAYLRFLLKKFPLPREINKILYVSLTTGLFLLSFWILWLLSEFTFLNFLLILLVYSLYLFWLKYF